MPLILMNSLADAVLISSANAEMARARSDSKIFCDCDIVRKETLRGAKRYFINGSVGYDSFSKTNSLQVWKKSRIHAGKTV